MIRPSAMLSIAGMLAIFFTLATLFIESTLAQPFAAGDKANAVLVDERFEGAFPPPGWSATGHWGKSECEASGGTSSAWIEGSATDRTCTGFGKLYHPNEGAHLRYGPFDLSDALTATLSFDLWLWQAQGDSFMWGASLDGASFYGITVTEAFTTLWEVQTLDLAAVPGLGDLRGDPAVYIGFTWQTDNFAETFGGAFVDNVRVVKSVTDGTETGQPTASNTATQTPTQTTPLTTTSSAHVYLPAVNGAPAATAPPTATATPTATTVPGNHAPIFPTPFLTEKVTENEFDSNGRLIGATTTITILTPATDQDGDVLTYRWSASNGTISGDGLVGTWTRVLENGRVTKGTVTVVADDGRGGTAKVTFEVN